jgi:hypothetical protein
MDGPPPGTARYGAYPVGQHPDKGLFYATGHGQLGLTYAATTARLMGDLITGAKTSIDRHLYRINRFQGGVMRWSRTIQTVDVHCAGEIGRVITEGVLNTPGATMAAKQYHLNSGNDDRRRWLCSEPRSGPAGSFCLLVPARDPAAAVGLIIL